MKSNSNDNLTYGIEWHGGMQCTLERLSLFFSLEHVSRVSSEMR